MEDNKLTQKEELGGGKLVEIPTLSLRRRRHEVGERLTALNRLQIEC
jgi:hypothetical protein